MADRVRMLNENGTARFRDFLLQARGDGTGGAPLHLLTDPEMSEEFEPHVEVLRGAASTRLEFGQRLLEWLSPADPRAISRNAGLWNWLALYFLDDLAPPDASGGRRLLAVPHYLLDAAFSYNRSYKHLVRFAWLSCLTHGAHARVLLAAAQKKDQGIGQWGEVAEQLGAYQWVFGSRAVVAAAVQLFLDDDGVVGRGVASKSAGGSARRLAAVCNQLLLTFDLNATAPERLIGLLPGEFGRWKRNLEKRQRRSADHGQGAPASLA